jgi:DNA-binding LacI/PurR family transcriptional regulator
MAATLHDLAAACACNVSTVSRALRDDPRISAEVRAKVQAAARELGYRPNLAARALVTGRSGTVWFLSGSLGAPTDHLPAEAMSRFCLEHGRDLLVATHHGDPTAHRRLLERLRQGVADGAVIAAHRPDLDSPVLRDLAASGFPLVFIDRHVPGIVAPVATTDHVAAASEVVARLQREGLRHIANLHDPRGNTVEVARAAALTSAATAAGLQLVATDGALPPHTAVVASSWSTFSQWRHAQPTLPAGTWVALYDLIVGDPPPGCTLLVIVQDFAAMGAAAWELLNRRMAGEPASGEIRGVPLAELRLTTG